jgi:rare lipoprotein A
MEFEGFTPIKIEEVPREARPRALRTNFRKITQVGQATGQFTGPGLTAAHPSISNGTKVKIVNQSNGREVVVTVIYRIRASQNRIIDLSQNAAQSLGILRGSSEVKIETME